MFFLQKLENSATEALKDALPQVFLKRITKIVFCVFALIQKVSEVIFSTFFVYCVLPLPLNLLFRFLEKT